MQGNLNDWLSAIWLLESMQSMRRQSSQHHTQHKSTQMPAGQTEHHSCLSPFQQLFGSLWVLMKYTVVERRSAIGVSLVDPGPILKEILNQGHISSLQIAALSSFEG